MTNIIVIIVIITMRIIMIIYDNKNDNNNNNNNNNNDNNDNDNLNDDMYNNIRNSSLPPRSLPHPFLTSHPSSLSFSPSFISFFHISLSPHSIYIINNNNNIHPYCLPTYPDPIPLTLQYEGQSACGEGFHLRLCGSQQLVRLTVLLLPHCSFL
jgi:hypothetical protein